jgi:hypothetical protein
MMLDASQYVERHDAALKRAHAAEEQVAALTREVEGLRDALETVDTALMHDGYAVVPGTVRGTIRSALAAADAARGTRHAGD